METKLIKAENNNLTDEQLQEAASLWQNGELLVFPTETVYGLGANAFNAKAAAAIFAVKGRPADNPLIVHLYQKEQLDEIAYRTELADKLLACFTPGPLTLILKKKSAIPEIVSGGLDTVAFRFPSHPVAQALLRTVNLPIAAPSANLSGRPSPTRAEHVIEDMWGRIPLLIDGGECEIGVESTVLDISGASPVLLRPGAVTKEQLETVCGQIQMAGAKEALRPAAPGMKYRHYAPRARVIIAQNAEDALNLYQREYLHGEIMVCLSAENAAVLSEIPRKNILILGQCGDYAAFAHNLFAFFRYSDERNAATLIVEALPEQGMGAAYMNRLRKASTKL